MNQQRSNDALPPCCSRRLTPAQDDKKSRPGGKDYAAELLAHCPKEPAEALKIQAADGFRIELVAPSPHPLAGALDIDENGRMFIVEYPEYNQYANKNFKAAAASACWRTPTATAATTRAPSTSITSIRRWLSPVTTAASSSGRAGHPLLQGH